LEVYGIVGADFESARLKPLNMIVTLFILFIWLVEILLIYSLKGTILGYPAMTIPPDRTGRSEIGPYETAYIIR
jgi:hypothetical protein